MRIDIVRVQTSVSKLGHTSQRLLRMRTYHVKAFTAVSLRRDTLQTILWMHMNFRSIQSLDKY